QRVDGGLLEFFADVGAVAVADVTPLDQEHVDALFRWVDPALCAERAAVAAGAGREHAGDVLRVGNHAPAQSPAVAGREASFAVAGLEGRHLMDGVAGENSLPVELADVQNHLVEAE